MNLRCTSVIFAATAILGLSSCSNSSVVSLDYVPGRMVRGTPDFVVGEFKDKRGQQAQTLGHVRLPVGPTVDTVQTRLPVRDIVRNAFAHALEARGMLAPDKGARFIIKGDIQDLRSQLLVHPYGYARIRVNVLDAATKAVVFTKVYDGERQSSAYRPGSGSPVPVLRELTSRALQDAVDRALDDPKMRESLATGSEARPRYAPGML
ncbi:MAG: hypothetical protein IAE77_04440 [Prosthecobacter sp.]|jgi:hypothetical protein|uniref:DUF4136 domain-containing protein n=1 Tax=Prosthecobacter sp. TaxID=1965333 RepID=UPI001A06ABF6|nr:DUF4136 domain-containing protein [Prosthecobacter sp.]MBE2282693.1 hypothetical protein [Prosthecobacter sp.]